VQKGITTQAPSSAWITKGRLIALPCSPGRAGTAASRSRASCPRPLRNAQQLSAGLPAGEPLRERIAALDAEVVMLTRAPTRKWPGRPEQAVGC